ncbi:MAG: Wzz/FepE/Etk N-terminal domain-containing protein [Verrucomicrobia bacterium]|nr:Wzz/FepE/Etk N-terminal domain-containing protein [Verrucomicrobiota bacterium]
MKAPFPEEPVSGLNLNEILYILFRRKGLITLCTAIGILSAGIYYFGFPDYESQAKLMVRYVLERNALDKLDTGPQTPASGPIGESMINAEVEILTSADVAMQVAEAIGVKRLLPDAKQATQAAAANAISAGLKASAKLGSNVILISYKNRDPQVTKSVLDAVVSQYFEKHMQVHRSLGTFGFVAKQTEQISSQLQQTEEELKRLKTNSGIVSVADSSANLTNVLVKSQQELDAAEVERAEQRARIQEIEKLLGGLGVNSNNLASEQTKNRKVIQEYQILGMRLDDMHGRERELLAKYTVEHPQVRIVQSQIAELESRRRELEKVYPYLMGTAAAVATNSPSVRFDLVTEKTRLASMDAKADTLSAQLRSFQEKSGLLSQKAIEIAQLERKREIEETNYRYSQTSLEKARIDEALDPSKIPNISVVQSPTEGIRDAKGTNKILLGLIFGGLGVGLVIAFLIEKVVDRTVKRALEIESKLGLPLLVSIPYVPPSGHLRLPPQSENDDSSATLQEIARSELGHQIVPFFEAIRDRLILYFKLNRLVRKPKLIAVTALTREAGISTVAEGLAASISELGDGKVLLVNMNVEHTEIQQFRTEKSAGSLVEVLQTGGADAPGDSEHHYLATVSHAHAGSAQFAPKNFYDLIPHIKSSSFDYIIFDMPPLTQTSATVALAGFMDKVLLVVEAGKTHEDTLRRSCKELAAAKADVSCVFNKARSCAPKFIEGEI